MSHQREIDLAYLAGLMDGEGYIGMSYNTRRTGTQYTPRVTITDTNEKIVAEVRRILTNESIAFYVSEWKSNKAHKKRFTIEAVGFRRSLKWLFVIEPHLIAKQEQARLLLAWMWSRLTHGKGYNRVPYTVDENNIYYALKELNAKGSVTLNEYTPKAAPYVAKMYSELRAKGAEATEMIARLERGENWSRSK